MNTMNTDTTQTKNSSLVAVYPRWSDLVPSRFPSRRSAACDPCPSVSIHGCNRIVAWNPGLGLVRPFDIRVLSRQFADQTIASAADLRRPHPSEPALEPLHRDLVRPALRIDPPIPFADRARIACLHLADAPQQLRRDILPRIWIDDVPIHTFLHEFADARVA